MCFQGGAGVSPGAEDGSPVVISPAAGPSGKGPAEEVWMVGRIRILAPGLPPGWRAPSDMALHLLSGLRDEEAKEPRLL